MFLARTVLIVSSRVALLAPRPREICAEFYQLFRIHAPVNRALCSKLGFQIIEYCEGFFRTEIVGLEFFQHVHNRMGSGRE